MKPSYAEKLKDARWLDRRAQIISACHNSCAQCQRTQDEIFAEQGRRLEVHHVAYLRGREPWDYPDDLLIALCNECHFNRQIFDEEALFEFARMLRRMDMWHVHDLKKRLQRELDGGFSPSGFNAYKEITRKLS